jgi:hypothetical protein
MAWPTVVATYKDASQEILTPDILEDWQALPPAGLIRLDFDPPTPGARAGFSYVITGVDRAWGYKVDANTFVVGSHQPDTTLNDLGEPNPNGTPEYFLELVWDRRPGREKVEREVAAIPPGAFVIEIYPTNPSHP